MMTDNITVILVALNRGIEVMGDSE